MVKSLFQATSVAEVKSRIGSLTSECQRQWGTMTPAQALAHCQVAMRMAFGEVVLPRSMVGRLIGPTVKKAMLVRGAPMRRNAPTHPKVLIKDDRDLAVERKQLTDLIDRFAQTRPSDFTYHPHFFFGRLTPEEWATLQYLHLDHHLRQFGA